MNDEIKNRNILFIENNYSLAGSWKKFLELLFEVDVTPSISVAEVEEEIKCGKFGIVFVHLPIPEKNSKAMAKEIRELENTAKQTNVPIYVFVLPKTPDETKEIIEEYANSVLVNDNMLIDAGHCIVRDLNIPPKMKNMMDMLDRNKSKT